MTILQTRRVPHPAPTSQATAMTSTTSRPAPARSLAWRLAAVLSLAVLAACGSPEEKQARYLEQAVAYYKEGNDAKAMVELRNVLQINSKNADAYYYLGLVHERAQRWPQAFAAYREAVDERPGFVEANLKLGSVGLLANQTDAVEKAVANLDKAAPDNPEAMTLKGAWLLRKQQPQAALDLARKVLAADAGNEKAAAVATGAFKALGQPDEALRFLDQRLAATPSMASLWLMKIALLQDEKQGAEVRATFEGMIKQFPDDRNYRLAYADFLRTQNDLPAAERVIRDTVARFPADQKTTALLVQLVYQAHGADAAEAELKTQIARNPDDRSLPFMLAELYTQNRKNDEARAVLDAVAGDAKAPAESVQDAQAGLAQIALAENRLDDAKALADKVVAANPEHRGANLVNGTVALKQGKLDEALRSTRTALRREPTWAPGLQLLAQIHIQRGETDLAIDTLNQLLAQTPDDLGATRTLAGLLTRRGDLDTAAKSWSSILERQPDDPQALQARAQIYLQQKNWSGAEGDVNRLLQQPKTQTLGMLLAGDMMIARQNFAQSRDWYTKAMAAAPDSPAPLLGMVRSYVGEKNVDGAVAFLRAQKDKRPDDAFVDNLLGQTLAQAGRYDEAATSFGQAIRLNPTWVAPRMQLAATLSTAGRPAEAATALAQADQAIPNNIDIISGRAAAELAAGQPLKALDLFERVVALAPDNEIAINNVAALTADHAADDPKRLQHAIDLAARFRTSSNPLFLDTLGWLYYRKGDFPVAVTFLDRAVILDGKRQDLRYHLGMALAKSGQTERARSELAKALSGSPDFDGVDDAKATLSDLERQATTGARAGNG